MHKQKAVVERFSQIPVPAAHLVVDIREGSDRRSIDWLQVELADLASEMQSCSVPRWRAVNEFLAFLRLAPDLQDSLEDAARLTEGSAVSQQLAQLQTSGQKHDCWQKRKTFAQHRDQVLQEIERVRANWSRAMQEGSPTGTATRSSDTRVRVVFLVDLACPASFSCALLWARHLKDYSIRQRRPARHAGLCVAVVCLGNSEEEGRPEFVRRELGRHRAVTYLDTLIFSENCCQYPPLEERAQARLAAQLLYALLFFASPSFTFFAPATPTPLPANHQEVPATIWPGQTYLVHLAALEDTASWGRRWLNHGLAQALVETLCLPTEPDELEMRQAADLGINWFRDWLRRLQERLSVVCDTLTGLQHVRGVLRPALPALLTGPGGRRSALARLESYLSQLADTYASTGSTPSLQEALVQGGGRIMQALSEKEHTSSSPQITAALQALEREARQVFHAPRFWQQISQPLALAPFFLEGLAGACTDLQQAYLRNPLNVRAQRQKGRDVGYRRQDLLDRGQRALHELTAFCARWPGLTSFPLLRRLVQWWTFFLQTGLIFLALFLGIAELHHALVTFAPGFASVLDIPGFPWLNLLAIGLWLLLTIGVFRSLRASFLRKRASNAVIAGKCLLFLALLGLCGFLVSLGFAGLAADPTSVVYLAWLAPVVLPVTRFCVSALVLLLSGEAIYFLCWSWQVRTLYRRTIQTWQHQQHQDVQDVIDCLATDVALEMAQRAEICDRAGGPGRYFYRINQLTSILRRLSTSAQQCADLAAERLAPGQGSTQADVEHAWMLAHPGGEALPMGFLIDEYAQLRQLIREEHSLQCALAEYLLRAEGVEEPEELAQDMRAAFLEVKCAHRSVLHLLISLVAQAARDVVDPLPAGRRDLLRKGAYQNEREYIGEEMPALPAYIQAFSAQVNLDSSDEQALLYLTGQLMALVAQMVWQQGGSERCRQRLRVNRIWERLEGQFLGSHVPDTVVRRLQMHAKNGAHGGQRADQYMQAATLAAGPLRSQALQGLMPSRVLDIPDQERLLLLSIRRVVAR